MNQKRKIILDCDPGHDDAIAILLASKASNIEVLGISTSAGNQTIEKTSKNALNVARYCGLCCPIAKGRSEPLVKPAMICPEIHGETGLDGFTFPEYKMVFDKREGYRFIIDNLLMNENVTIVTTGPMTNFARALEVDPRIKEHIKEVVFMGGSFGYGNISPAAEFNILVDPEAADIVIRSGLPIKMIGLDVTRKFNVSDEIIEKCSEFNTKESKLFVDLMKVFLKNERATFSLENAPLHDPLTIIHLIDESIIKFKKVNCEIDLSHGPSYGRTNCDMMDYLKRRKNVEVAYDLDANKAWEILINSLK